MNEKCDCNYCKNKVDEYFCINCGQNFNECEAFFEYKDEKFAEAPTFGQFLCPHCVPKDFNKKIKGVERRKNK